MIKFLKKLFGKEEQVKAEVKVVEPEVKFVPENEIEVYLINSDFNVEENTLVKYLHNMSIIYNRDTKVIMITKEGGNISLVSYGSLNKVKRFLDKYII